jgi:hypothetical protein
VVAPLDGCWAKFNRAREHFVAFRTEVVDWMENNAGSVRCDPGGRAFEHTWSLDLPVPPPKIRWGVLIGDALHNMRSSLDHLAWQLALKDGEPPGYTAFPIFRNREDAIRTDASGNPRRGSALYKIAGIRDPLARDAIESVQPYKSPDGPDGHPLWILQTLNNADKHRIIQPMLIQTNYAALPWRPLTDAPAGSITVAFNHDPLEDEPAFARITSTDAVLEAGDDYDVTIEPQLDIGEDLPLVNAVALPDFLLNDIDWMLTQFQRSFFTGADKSAG